MLDDGRKVTSVLVRQLLAEELRRIRELLGEKAWHAGNYEGAAQLFEEITTSEEYVEFLTLPAYDLISRVAHVPHEEGAEIS